MSFCSAITDNPFTNSISEQYRYFRSLNQISQLAIVAHTVGGGTTCYASSNALIPHLAFSIPIGILGSIGFSKASFKVEGKKAVRIENSKFYNKSILDIEQMIADVERETNRLLELAIEKTDKSYGISDKEDKRKEKIADSDYDTYINEVRIKNKHLRGEALTREIQTARRVYHRQKAGKINRGDAAKVAYEARMDKIEGLRDQIQQDQVQPVQAERDNDVSAVGLDSAVNENTSPKNSSSHFAQRFSVIFETCLGGGEGFIGASTFLYVILSNSLSSDYTSPAVIVPCIVAGLAASIFGAKGRYNDHKAEEEEKLQFGNFKNKIIKLEEKYERIKKVNSEIKKLLFNLVEETDEVKSLSPKEVESEPVMTEAPVQRRFSLMNLFLGARLDQKSPKPQELVEISVANPTVSSSLTDSSAFDKQLLSQRSFSPQLPGSVVSKSPRTPNRSPKGASQLAPNKTLPIRYAKASNSKGK